MEGKEKEAVEMLKGCQREMIVIATGDSPLFEQAYFVLRKEKCMAKSEDMLAEANRIIGVGDRYAHKKERRGKNGARVAAFCAGAVVGLALFFAAHLLFHF